MTDKGKKTLIGSFVLGAIAILLATIFLVGSGSLFNNSYRFVCYFSSSLRGLLPGSPVNLHGVRIGRVISVQINSDTNTLTYSIPVIIEVERDTVFSQEANTLFNLDDAERAMANYVERGLRAQLGTQSLLTGQLSVDLDFVETTEVINPENLPRYQGLMQIPTVPTQLDAVWDTFSKIPFDTIATQLLETITSLNTALVALSTTINESNVPRLVNAYTDVALKSQGAIEELSDILDTTALTMKNFKNTSQSIDNTVQKITPQMDSVLISLNGLIKNMDGLLTQASSLLSEDSTTMLEIGQTLQSIRDASYAITQLANLLDIQPQSLIFGKKPQ